MTFHARWSPEIEAEGPVRMTWEIEPAGEGVSKLTVVTSGMVEGGAVQGEFGDGIVHIVSGLKTLVETGEALDEQVRGRLTAADVSGPIRAAASSKPCRHRRRAARGPPRTAARLRDDRATNGTT